MHVTRVELENIKSYTQAAFDFARGTTAITGRNGAGKTTILEAIAWALFDSLEYSKTDFIRRGTKKGSVRITFQSDVDERLYTVYRDTANGYYIFDEALKARIAEQKKDVGDTLRLHLGIEPGMELKALFRSAIGVPQGLFTAAFLESAVKRKSEFDRLLKVEEYRDGAERLLATANLVNSRVEDARRRIAGAEGQLARYDLIVDERRDAEARVSELTAEATEAEQETRTHEHEAARLDEAERELSEATTLVHKLEVQAESIERSLRDAEAELDQARRAAATRDATFDAAEQHKSALATLKELEIERRTRDALQIKINDARHTITKTEDELARTSESLSRAELARESLIDLQPDIERQARLEREREGVVNMRAEAANATTKLKRFDTELNSLRAEHKHTRELMRELETLKDAPQRLHDLDINRKGDETELSRAENAFTAHKHLSNARHHVAAELSRADANARRIADEILMLEIKLRNAVELDVAAQKASDAATAVSSLRGDLARDERFQKEVTNGLCPILTERCLNLKAGQNLATYFADQVPALRARLAVAEATYTETQTSYRAAQQAEKLRLRFDDLQAQLAREHAAIEDAQTKLENYNAEIETLKAPSDATLKAMKLRLRAIDDSLIKARDEAMRYQELSAVQIKLQEIEIEGKRRKEERADLEAIANGLGGLEDDLRDLNAHLEALNNPRARAASLAQEAAREPALRAAYQTIQAQLEAHQTHFAQLENEIKIYAALDENLSAQTALRDATATDYHAHLTAHALATKLIERERKVTALNNELALLRERESQATASLQQARDAYNREQHNRVRGLLQLARDRYVSIQTRLTHTRATLESVVKELAELDEVKVRMQAELAEVERLRRLYEAIDFIRDTLKKAGPLVTESYLAGVSKEANTLFREITGEAHRSLRWTRDYEVVMEEAGHDRPFHNLSGGEQMVAALSIRLALLKQLSDIRLAIFDEPTTNMDAERRARLAEAIGNVRHFDQLFVISHDDSFESSVDYVVNVETGTGDGAGVRDRGLGVGADKEAALFAGE